MTKNYRSSQKYEFGIRDPQKTSPGSSVADPDPGSGSGVEKNPDLGFGMSISDLLFENFVSFCVLKILKFFDADPDPGSGINIPDP